jgi:hypothetical protein
MLVDEGPFATLEEAEDAVDSVKSEQEEGV